MLIVLRRLVSPSDYRLPLPMLRRHMQVTSDISFILHIQISLLLL